MAYIQTVEGELILGQFGGGIVTTIKKTDEICSGRLCVPVTLTAPGEKYGAPRGESCGGDDDVDDGDAVVI